MDKKEIEKVIIQNVEMAIDAEEEVALTDRLVDDLDAESLDIIDILFKSGKEIGVKLSMKDLQASFRGELTEEAFINSSGEISEEGMRELTKIFGRDIISVIGKEASTKDLLRLLDVHYIVRLFEEQIGKHI